MSVYFNKNMNTSTEINQNKRKSERSTVAKLYIAIMQFVFNVHR